MIEELLEAFDMDRTRIHKGCPYDNDVVESKFKIIKTEFIWNERFAELEELKLKLWYYVKRNKHLLCLIMELCLNQMIILLNGLTKYLLELLMEFHV